ncbi:MAG: hypothetical protein P1U56_17910 [Saprospiraceae bacterium]|nr:hypothetical protein [Saprospiraceae bacterium]
MLNKLSEGEKEAVFQHFLLNNKHNEHEEIAGAFQRTYHQNEKNAELLLTAINKIPAYLSMPDLKYSYIRKCIYAIGAQPNPININSLKILSAHQDIEIRKLAEHQLNKRIELGRWENDKFRKQ